MGVAGWCWRVLEPVQESHNLRLCAPWVQAWLADRRILPSFHKNQRRQDESLPVTNPGLKRNGEQLR